MKNSMAEVVIKEMVTELRIVGNGTDEDFFLKPLRRSKVQSLLQHIADLSKELDARRKLDADNLKMATRLGKSLAAIESIKNSQFPNSAAKGDLLQQMAATALVDIESN